MSTVLTTMSRCLFIVWTSISPEISQGMVIGIWSFALSIKMPPTSKLHSILGNPSTWTKHVGYFILNMALLRCFCLWIRIKVFHGPNGNTDGFQEPKAIRQHAIAFPGSCPDIKSHKDPQGYPLYTGKLFPTQKEYKRTTKRHSTSSPRIRCANFSPDAAYVCTGAFDGVAKVSWPPGEGVVLCRFCIAWPFLCPWKPWTFFTLWFPVLLVFC